MGRDMVSGRGAVLEGWSYLSVQVRTGPLSSTYGSGPNRRALRPLLRRLFPDYRVSVLTSAGNTLEDYYDPQQIVERIAGADSWLQRVGLLIHTVKAELFLRRVTPESDPLFTLTIARAPGPDEEAPAKSWASRVVLICDDLDRDESRSVAALKRLFEDPVQKDLMLQRLEASWAQRCDGRPMSEEVGDYREYLDIYLAAVGQSTGQESWSHAVSLDASAEMLHDLRAAGLSAYPAPVRPSLHDRVSGAPLDQSIYMRLWSVLKGAAGREWLPSLPELVVMASLEIDASALPLGMRTAWARTGLGAGARAYASITPDEPARLLCEQPGAVGYLNRKIATFLSAVGGFGRLDPTAQDQLSNSGRALIPGLWTKLHNAEYRGDVLQSPTWVWDQIAGEVETLIREIKQRHTKSRVGVSRRSWGTAAHVHRTPREPVAVADEDRDLRVRDAMSELSHVLGREALEDVLKMRDKEARDTWDQAVSGVASWGDLLGYLDDHLPRD